MAVLFSNMDWVSLEPYLDDCQAYAQAVNELKSGYKSSRYLHNNPHYIGALAECIFADQFGLSRNWNVRYQGDDGHDFLLNGWKIDIKACTYWRYPDLKEFPNVCQSPDIYVLAALDLNRHRGRLVGFCSAYRLFLTPPSDYRGLGLRYWISGDSLCTDWSLLDTWTLMCTPPLAKIA